MNKAIESDAEVSSQTEYDEIPYPGGATRNTHPCHLAMVARLNGLAPAPPAHCRVLELGCSMGANLIPIAQDFPDSEFVGVDLSERQIAEGQALLRKLELDNVELRHLNIAEVDDHLGQFDYIICHGVYSWVPQEVQRAILRVGQRQLSSCGLLYVSYNTYPGWHLRGAIREMMLYHVAPFEAPEEKIRQARGLLKFLEKSAKVRSKAYLTLLQEEADLVSNHLDYYIYHEHLEGTNEPVYFHEFVRDVEAAGLRDPADSELSTMMAQLFDESAAEFLRGVPLLRCEQYMDFLRSRTFRCSLLCRPELQPDYGLSSTRLLPLHVSLQRPPKRDKPETAAADGTHGPSEIPLEPAISAAFEQLKRRFPAWVAVADLADAITNEQEKKRLLDSLLRTFLQGLLRLAEDPPMICADVPEKPLCTPLTRIQAAEGPHVTTRLHTELNVHPQHRFLIQHLDGTRTSDQLAELLQSEILAGRLKVTRESENVQQLDADTCREIVRQELARLCSMSMLAG